MQPSPRRGDAEQPWRWKGLALLHTHPFADGPARPDPASHALLAPPQILGAAGAGPAFGPASPGSIGTTPTAAQRSSMVFFIPAMCAI